MNPEILQDMCQMLLTIMTSVCVRLATNNVWWALSALGFLSLLTTL